MSRVKRELRRQTVGGHAIKINGEVLNIHFVRIAYRCADCLGTLEIHNAGVRCKAQCGGKRFITKQEAEKLEQQRREQMAEVESAYEIVDGKIIYKEQS